MNFKLIFVGVLIVIASLAQDEEEENKKKPFIRPSECNPTIIKCPAYFKHWRYNATSKNCTQHYFCLQNQNVYMQTKVDCENLCNEPPETGQAKL